MPRIVVSVEGSAVDVGKANIGHSCTANNVTDVWGRSTHVSLSSFSGESGISGCMIAEHGIEDGKALSSHGDEWDFMRFAGGREARVEGFEWPIEAAGEKDGHVARIAHFDLAVPGHALVAERAGIAIQWGAPDAICDGVPIQGAKFWQIEEVENASHYPTVEDLFSLPLA